MTALQRQTILALVIAAISCFIVQQLLPHDTVVEMEPAYVYADQCYVQVEDQCYAEVEDE